MKRIMSIFLLVTLLTSILVTTASAATFSTPSLAKGAVANSANVAKTTGNGIAATGSVTLVTTGATFHFRAWKHTAWQASEGKRVTGIGSFTLPTLYDGDGQPRLWQGTSYYLAVTHSSASSKTSALCGGNWNP